MKNSNIGVGTASALAPVTAQAGTKKKFIDFEHHFYAKELVEFLKKRSDYPLINKAGDLLFHEGVMLPMSAEAFNPGRTLGEDLTDIDEFRIRIMEENGLDCGMLSTSPLIEELPKDEAVKFARLTNDTVAAACKRHPGRFLGTICLPTPYVEESLKELDRAVNLLGLQFWNTHSNYNGVCLYEEKFEPILAKCAELSVPFYVHPQNPATPYLLDSGPAMAFAGFGFGVDVMKTTLRLIISGLFDKYPNLKMILGHMGEYYPYSLERLNNRFATWSRFDPMIKCKKTFTEYFKNKNIFMTTSGVLDSDVILFAIKTIGIDNVLFGTDYPYESLKESVEFVKGLPISNEDKEKIFFRNAEKYILR